MSIIYINSNQPMVKQNSTTILENNSYAHQTQSSRISNLVIENDQSFVKGVLWGLGGATLGLGIATLTFASFIVTPAFPIPLALGIATAVFGSLTSTCIENANYHFSSRKVIVLQNL